MKKIIAAIEAIIEESEKMKNCYFFSGISGKSCRSKFEREHSHDKVEWTEGGHDYTAAFDVRCSCCHVYAKGEYTKDGKKTTLKAIKSSLRRLKESSGM